MKRKCELQVPDYDNLPPPPPPLPPQKKQQYKTDSTLLEKIQSHPQMSAQKLCFGFSSPDIF